MQNCVRPTRSLVHRLACHMSGAQACINYVHSLLSIFDWDSDQVFNENVALLFSYVELLRLCAQQID